ncbi:flagellar brake protein [Pontibacillus litoralis]|uniref:Pilus biosynthesis protein PilZ n=1 Tax=Pontibacillus litoralis JSM 072002 TaxID=1385512 RepID=A0A0A5G9Y0_9BACI|nr:flagellar brake domain-containing protein [Pontibacillus litoralis]KGX87983.1 pilus biosynthesis protein PilZ [Pontibacillus litoralis JSM 072002]
MFKIGTTLTLQLIDDDNLQSTYRSTLVEYNDHSLFLDYPIHEESGKVGFFLDGTQFKVTFIGEDESLYTFQTEICERRKLNIPVIVVPFPNKEEMYRIQRRKYVRVEAALDVSVHNIIQEFSPFTTITVDISGGGLSFIAPLQHEMEENNMLEIWFVLPFKSGDVTYVKAAARVIRIWESEGKKRDQVSVEFETISENDQQCVIRYCFERQLANKKRGLL